MSDLTKVLREFAEEELADRYAPTMLAAADEIDRLGNLVVELNGVILQLNDKLEAAEGDG